MKDKSSKTIVLARHGQTDFNVESKVQDPVNPTLTEKGRKQARALGKNVEQMGTDFGLIICANTKRTIQTLAEIYPEYKRMEHVKVNADLNERHHVELVGKSKHEIKDGVGGFDGRLSWELYYEGTNNSVLTKKFPKNETIGNVRERVRRIVKEIEDSPHNAILLIGSSIVNHYLLEELGLGTIGEAEVVHPKTKKQLDFQKNDEIRVVTVDENMKTKSYESIDIA